MTQNIDLATLNSNQGFSISGSAANDLSGSSVSGLGDINLDGYADIIIGAPLADPSNRYSAGISYVIFGKASGFTNINLASLSSTQGFSILGAVAGDYSGQSVSAAGDVNGDGYTDIIVGSPQADPSGKSLAGISYVIFGKANGFTNIDLASLSSTEGFSILGAVAGDYSGQSVSSAGDINKDGYADIIIGAPQADPSGKSQAGISYVIFGKANGFTNIDLASLSSTEGFSILGAVAGDQSGNSVSAAGDINKDGYADIIIGAPTADPSGKSLAGTSYVIFGKANGFTNIDLASLSSAQGFSIYGAYNGDYSGSSVSGAGDINKDGYADIIIGAPFANPNSKADAGTSYVIFGKASGFTNINLATLSSTQGFSVLGATAGDTSGVSVSAAGDINKDGYTDIIIGASGADPSGKSLAGTSYIIFGKSSGFTDIYLSSLSSAQGFSILGAAAGDQSGNSVSDAGDINGDGKADIIIGAIYADPNNMVNAGTSYIIFDVSATNYPTFIPTLKPTSRPTFPTTLPTNIPTLQSTLSPTALPTDTHTLQPTLSPTTLPTNIPTLQSTLSPTALPTDIPTLQPTLSPTTLPTNIPTLQSTLSPTALPTDIPTLQPTLSPTIVLTSMPTQAIEIKTGGTYNGTGSNQNFIINSASDVTIYGSGSNNMFTLEPQANVLITVTNFNNYSDLINLKSYDIYSYDQLNITAGSIVITLEDNQIMKLLELSPGDINANNFVFSSIEPTQEPTSSSNSDSSDTDGADVGAIAGGTLAGVAFLSIVGYGLYAYTNQFWPFVAPVINEAVKEIELKAIDTAVDVATILVNNPIIGNVVDAGIENIA